MSTSLKCSFCDKKTFEHQIVHETDSFYVIHSHRPLARGHCLIIPKMHLSTGTGVEPKNAAEFISLANMLIQALSSALNSIGTNFFSNYGKAAGQKIQHAHFHFVPRYTTESVSPFEKLRDPDFRSKNPLEASDLEKEIELIKREIEKGHA